MRNFIAITFLTFLFSACQCNKNVNSKTQRTVNTNYLSNQISTDTLFFKNDTILKFDGNADGYGIFRWGVVNQFENTSKDTLHFDKIDKDLIKSKNSFVFSDDCGSACNFSLIMPIEKNKHEIMAMYPLITDQKTGYLIAKGDDDKVLLLIIDLYNSKISKIYDKFDKTKIPPSLAIDTIYMNKSKLIIKWYKNNSEFGFKEIDLSKKW